MILHNDENNRLDHTWQEVADAGFAVLVDGDPEENAIVEILALLEESDNSYVLGFWDFTAQEGVSYVAETKDDYPVYTPN